MPNFFQAFAAAACIAAFVAPIEGLKAYDLKPIVVQLSPSGPGSSQTMVVTNSHDVPIAIEVHAFQRFQLPTGEDRLEAENEDLIVYPPQMVIPPKSSQSFKVQWIGDPAPQSELAFRIVTEQLPIKFSQQVEGDHKADLTVRYRYEAALYVMPSDAEPSARLVSVERVKGKDGADELEVAIASEGNMRAILQDPKLELSGSGGSAIELSGEAVKSLEGLNILPGVERLVRIASPSDLPPGRLSGALQTRYVVLQ